MLDVMNFFTALLITKSTFPHYSSGDGVGLAGARPFQEVPTSVLSPGKAQNRAWEVMYKAEASITVGQGSEVASISGTRKKHFLTGQWAHRQVPLPSPAPSPTCLLLEPDEAATLLGTDQTFLCICVCRCSPCCLGGLFTG